MSDTIYLDGTYRFNQSRNIMAPMIGLLPGQRVSFRMETGAAGSNVILLHTEGGTPYECRLSFDNQKEADEWIDGRKNPPPMTLPPSESLLHPNR